MLDGNIVEWDNGKTYQRDTVDVDTEVAFFYGLPDVGRNFVWRPINTNPSLAVNYIDKVKSTLKSLTVLTR